MTDDGGVGYQFIATYNSAQKGQLSVYYFTAGDTGTASTIGVVGSDPNGSELSYSIFFESLSCWLAKTEYVKNLADL